MHPPAVVSRGRIAAKLGIGSAYTVVLAMLCNVLIEVLQTGGNFERLLDHTLGSAFRETLLGTGVIWVLVLLLWALSGRLSVTTFVLLVSAMVIGYANYLKITLRHEPLYPSDLDFAQSPGFLVKMVHASTLGVMVALIVALGMVVVLGSRLLRRSLPRLSRSMHPRLWWTGVFTRLVAGSLAVTFLFYAASFNATDNRLRAAYEASGAHWAFWFQQLNYYENGFVGGVLYNLDVPAMVEPRGYSRSAMEDIVRRYSDRAAELNADSGSRTAARKPNIVLILSEAFSDPTRLKGVKYDEDPIPFTRALMAKATSGTMLAQLFGGGTANMEFEALTGMSLSQFQPQMNTPYQMLVPKYQRFPSLVGYLESKGYASRAVHPYMTSMYKRETVYPILGFDRFIGESQMKAKRKLEKSDFISDDSAFKETENQLQESIEPTLVNLVTMQNHVPMGGSYLDPLPVSGVSGDAKESAGAYGRGLEYTDRALKAFLDRLDDFDEDTVVVFYGDHLPAIWPDSVYEPNGYLRMRETPYFYWANFDLPKAGDARVDQSDLFRASPVPDAGRYRSRRTTRCCSTCRRKSPPWSRASTSTRTGSK